MKIKYYKVTEDDILKWWFGLRDGDCSRQYFPLEIISDLKTGTKEWYHKGIPLRLQTKFPLVDHRAKTNETK